MPQRLFRLFPLFHLHLELAVGFRQFIGMPSQLAVGPAEHGLRQAEHGGQQRGHHQQEGKAGVASHQTAERFGGGLEPDGSQLRGALPHGQHDHDPRALEDRLLEGRSPPGRAHPSLRVARRQGAGLVVEPGRLDVRVGPQSVEVFLGGGLIVEREGRGDAGRKDPGLGGHLADLLRSIELFVVPAESHAEHQ